MDYRKAEIKQVLTSFLDRFAPPQHIRENTDAQRKEAEALLSVMVRSAPREDAGQWANTVLDRLAEKMTHRVWPMAKELSNVCTEFRKSNPFSAMPVEKKPEVEIIGDLMRAGEPVGEAWLYGVKAVELIAARQVTKETMTRYRSALFFGEVRVMNDRDIALRREAERKHKHQLAIDDHKARRNGEVRQSREFEIATNEMVSHDWVEANEWL